MPECSSIRSRMADITAVVWSSLNIDHEF